VRPLHPCNDLIDTDAGDSYLENGSTGSCVGTFPRLDTRRPSSREPAIGNGQLSAVIDFGGLGVGDPACDLIVAWNLFSAEARNVFRATLSVDDATWERGRGWALSTALIALPYIKIQPCPCRHFPLYN